MENIKNKIERARDFNDRLLAGHAELLKALRGLLASMSEWCECSAIQLLNAKAIARDAIVNEERRIRCS